MTAHGANDVTIPLIPQVGGGLIFIGFSEVATAIIVILMTDARTLTRRGREARRQKPDS